MEVKEVCEAVINSQTEETISRFSTLTEELPTKIIEMKGTFGQKLQFLKDNHYFDALLACFSSSLSLQQQLRILKLWDIFFQTAGDKEDYDILFSNDMTNKIILFAFDLNSEDIRQSYATVLKGISLKFKDFNHDYLIYKEEVPILSHSLPFINFQDSVTVSAMRFVILNLCLSPNPQIQEALSDKPSLTPIEFLINNIDVDGFAFLADFLQVAPLDLKNYALNLLRKKLDISGPGFFATAITFLAASQAKSLLMEIIDAKIKTWDLRDPLILGIILFSIEKKLIKVDIALRHGFNNTPIPLFNKSTRQTERKDDLLRELQSIMDDLISPVHTAVILRIYMILFKNLYEPILKTKERILHILRTEGSQDLLRVVMYPPTPLRTRTDLDFLQKSQEIPPRFDNLMLILAEIQGYITRYVGDAFIWYSVPGLELHRSMSFNLMNEGQQITADANTITINGTTLNLKNCIITLETKKFVSIKYVTTESSPRRASLPFRTQNETLYNFDFESGNVAQSFIEYVYGQQWQMCLKMLDAIAHNK